MRRVNGTIDAAVDPQILVRTKEFFKVETETYMNIMFLGLYGFYVSTYINSLYYLVKGGLRSRYNQLHIFAVTAMCGLTTGFMVICLHELRTRFQVLYQGSDTDNNDNDFDGLKGVDGVLGRDLKRQFELFGANVAIGDVVIACRTWVIIMGAVRHPKRVGLCLFALYGGLFAIAYGSKKLQHRSLRRLMEPTLPRLPSIIRGRAPPFRR